MSPIRAKTLKIAQVT